MKYYQVTDEQLEEIDRLRTVGLTPLLEYLYPLFRKLAKVSSVDHGVADADDAFNSGVEAILRDWDDKTVTTQKLMGRVGYRMQRERDMSLSLTSGDPRSAVSAAKRFSKEIEAEGVTPSLRLISERSTGTQDGMTLERLVGALIATELPLHLDYAGSGESIGDGGGLAGHIDSALIVEEVYGKDDDQVRPELYADLMRRIWSLTARARLVLERYLETEGDIIMITKAFEFESDEKCEYYIYHLLRRVATIDESEREAARRIREGEIRQRAKERPECLDCLADKARAYFEASLTQLPQEISATFGVTEGTIHSSLGESYAKLKRWFTKEEEMNEKAGGR